MQATSALYKSIFADPRHTTETRVDIAGTPYDEHALVSVRSTSSIFPGDDPAVGGCVARKIRLTLLKPSQEIPPMAKLEPYVRLTDGERVSEWLPKGKFYIDTRRAQDVDAKSDGLSIEGFCDMMKAETDCPLDGLDWPARDIDVARLIAQDMGVELDRRTVEAINKGYPIQLPTGYSSREVLSGIAAMYGGAFIMSDEGKLLFVALNGIPKETYYLITNDGSAITFGGVKIIV